MVVCVSQKVLICCFLYPNKYTQICQKPYVKLYINGGNMAIAIHTQLYVPLLPNGCYNSLSDILLYLAKNYSFELSDKAYQSKPSARSCFNADQRPDAEPTG